MNRYLVCCEVKRQEIVEVKAANIEEAKEEAKYILSDFDEVEIEHVSVPRYGGGVCVNE